MTVFTRINRWEDIPAAISMMQQAGVGHRVPLMQALYRGRIAHFEMQRTGTNGLFKRWTAAVQLPAVLLIGDDDHASPDGPDTWSIAAKAMRWARFVLIHGGVGKPEHYSYAITLAEQFHRLLLIECSSANVQSWRAAAERWAVGAEGQIMQPPPGISHPVLTRGDVH